jgi:SAM-dependent methyltransferase
VAGAVEALPLGNEKFDAICCVDLVHHLPGRMPQIFRSFHRILGPGGMLFLEDINAWGLFQAWKSILLPRPLHGALRNLFHTVKGSTERPAPYEFPTSVWKAIRILEDSGFRNVTAIPQAAYPNTGAASLGIYHLLSRSERVRRYHNFHYMIYAEK